MARDGGGRSGVGSTTLSGSRSFQRGVTLGAPVAGIVLSEALVYVGFTRYALTGYVLTLVICTLAPLRFRGEINTFSAFALVPLLRLVSFGMPPFFETTGLMLGLVYAPMFLPLYLFASRESVLEVTWRAERRGLLFIWAGVLIGVGLAELGYEILQPEPLISVWNVPQVATMLIVFFLFGGLVEEFLFRGVLQRTLQKRLGRWSGLLLVSAIFGVTHAGYGSVEAIALGAVSGVVYGILYDWTDSIGFITSIHGTLSLFLFVVIPIHGTIFGRLVTFVSRTL